MRKPAVLLRSTKVGRLQSWLVVTGDMHRWGLVSDRLVANQWASDGIRLGIASAPATRALLLRRRREILATHVESLAWQDYPLSEAFGRVPAGLDVETAVACLWWLTQRNAGASMDAAGMLLNLVLDSHSADRFTVREDGMLGCRGYEVVYAPGRSRSGGRGGR